MTARRAPTRSTFALLCAAALALPAASCSDDAPRAARPASADAPLPVSLAPVVVREAQRAIEVTGALYGEEEATISSKLRGRVASIERDLGDVVPAAGVLAQLERRDFELELAEREAEVRSALARLGLTSMPEGDFDASSVPTVRRARAEADNARARLERSRMLFDQQPPLISEQEFADAQTTWQVAHENAEVELLSAQALLAQARSGAAAADAARQQLVDATVRAPSSPARPDLRYQVAQRLVSVGEYVGEGQRMFRLVASDIVKLVADVPERFAGQVAPGQTALVRVEAAGEPARGSVTRVAPAIDPATRTFKIEARIENPAGALRPGAFARAAILVRTEPNIAFVPQSAVVTFAGVQRVYSVKDAKAVEHRVHLGQREGDLVEIVGGLPVTEVVTTGAQALTPAAPVSVRSPAP